MIEAEERASMEETVRSALAGAVATSGADADAVLQSLGWLEMLAEHPDDAIAIVCSALGATNAAAALDDVLSLALGREPRADSAVALPCYAGWSPPARVVDGLVQVNGLTTARAPRVREVWVVCGAATRTGLILLPIEEAQLDRVRGADPSYGLHTIRARRAASEIVTLDPASWSTAVALGRRAIGHQIAGACRAMLELARRHALERSQFGRPIARFQAVRHRLAEALVAVEALESALQAARDESGSATAALAKAVAGCTARTVARHCQQVLAGIGFTTEHAFHRYLKRTLALEGLFGSADAIALDQGRQLLASRRVPTLIDL